MGVCLAFKLYPESCYIQFKLNSGSVWTGRIRDYVATPKMQTLILKRAYYGIQYNIFYPSHKKQFINLNFLKNLALMEWKQEMEELFVLVKVRNSHLRYNATNVTPSITFKFTQGTGILGIYVGQNEII